MNWSEIAEKAPQLAIEYGVNALAAIAIFLIGKWIARRLIALMRTVLERQSVDSTISGFLSNIAYMVLLALVIIAALAQLGIPTASFIAIIGAAGLAIGLALQGSLSNFASGVLLVAFRPCRVGDYIEAAGQSGTVDRITIFSTTLLTPDQRTITIPNSDVFGGPIVNYSTSPIRRLDLVIGISYDADADVAMALLRDVVSTDQRVLADRDITIGVLELADSAVNIAVRPWVNASDYWPLRFDLMSRIKHALDDAGIGIPYPQRDVYIHHVDDRDERSTDA